MKLSIIGAGYVGLVSGAAFAEMGHEVTVMDIDASRIEKLRRCIMPIHEPGLDRLVERNMDAERLFFTTDLEEAVRDAAVHFVCVGTPPNGNGSADISVVLQVAGQLGSLFSLVRAKHPIVVTKSTVPVGTGEKVMAAIRESFSDECGVVSNPEFLREGQAVADMLHPDRIVIGSDNEHALATVESLYAKITSPVITTSLRTAELIKYAANAFLATKISFINEVAAICDLLGADVTQVAEGIGSDKRIGKAFLKPGLGYGGSCLPKDVSAMRHFAKEAGYECKILKATESVNAQQQKKLVTLVTEQLMTLERKNVLVLGLAFKAGTDDIRASPAIAVANQLSADGALVRAYDPVAMLNAKDELSNSIELVSNPVEGARDADCIVIATEWPEFADLDWAGIQALMHKPIVVDGRNMLDPKALKALGFSYFDIGRN